MQILFSPSESKLSPKSFPKQHASNTTKALSQNAISILDDALWGGQVARNANINAYLSALAESSDTQISKIFGTKHIDFDTLSHCLNLANSPRIQAIKLYNGVAFRALDFASLDKKAQDFILDSVLIFSNLFGLVRAKDCLPYYHLNQNYRSQMLSLNALYKAQKNDIDNFLGINLAQNLAHKTTPNNSNNITQKTIIDLRAGVYIKAYPLITSRFKIPHYILPIPKGTSHSAKLHRGLALRELANAFAQSDEAVQKMLDERFIYVD